MTTEPNASSSSVVKMIRENANLTRAELAERAGITEQDLTLLEDSDSGTFENLCKIVAAMGAETALLYKDGVFLNSPKDPIRLLLEHDDIYTKGLGLPSRINPTVSFQMYLYAIGQKQFLTTAAVDRACDNLNFALVFIKRVKG